MEYGDSSSQVGTNNPDPPLDQDRPEGESVWDVEIDPAVKVQIKETYLDVWNEFYEWEQEACRNEIISLSADISPSSGPTHHLGFRDEDSLDFEFEGPGESSDDAMQVESSDSYSFTIHDFSEHVTSTVVCAERKLKYHPPYPKYYACTPISCNIAQVKNFKVARFIPFDGDAKFNSVRYLQMKQWRSFVWQDSWVDPDGISYLSFQSNNGHELTLCVI